MAENEKETCPKPLKEVFGDSLFGTVDGDFLLRMTAGNYSIVMQALARLSAAERENERLRSVLSEVYHERDFRVRCNDYIINKVEAALTPQSEGVGV
jgi:hypothetical protein